MARHNHPTLVTDLLAVVQREIPNFHRDRDANDAAIIALVSALAAVGAHIILRDGETRFGKMLNFMVQQVNHLAHLGVDAIRDKQLEADVDAELNGRNLN